MELVFLGVLFIFSGILLLQTFTYTIPSYDTSGGPALFPQYILILLMVCIIILSIQLVRNKEGRHFIFLEIFKNIRGIFLFSIVLYLFALNLIGFLLGTSLFLLITVNYLTYEYTGKIGTKREILLRSLLIISIVLIVNFLFGDVFKIMLPKGLVF